jgi:serine/threonine protein kinase/Tfp pilus assembly protein PilF
MVCLLDAALDGDTQQSEVALALTPDQFGAYTIERHVDGSAWELGRGAMGITYRAIDAVLDRPVALKIINTSLASRSSEARERFMREARAAAALRHPNVATVYQFGIHEETGQFFYAMELVEGETLEQRVRRLGPLDVLTTVDIALQVSSALAGAEKRGLVHRDLKPGNLMILARDGEEAGTPHRGVPTVKIIDFGVAKAVADKTNAMALTHGGFVGTPAFASPEQFTNSPVDVRSDIYSLGATLWFSLTGRMPFRGRTVEQIREAQQSKPLPVQQLKAARVPRLFAALLVSMLAIERTARPPGARELGAELQRIHAAIVNRRNIVARFATGSAIILIVAASAFFVAGWLHTHPGFARSGPDKIKAPTAAQKSVAVLPFKNLSSDPENEFFADGVQDEILTRLAKIRDVKVISRTSTQKYKNAAPNLSQVAKQLGVANVLEGSVQKSGDQIRITVQLIKASNDSHLWAESYDRKLSDLFLVESDVAQKIAAALEAKLTGREKIEITAAATRNPEAYDAFLRALTLRNKPGIESKEKLREFCRRAVELDPKYVEARAVLGIVEAEFYFDTDHTDAQLTRARTAAETALRLAPESADAHAAMGIFLYYCLQDFDRALIELNIARERAPNDANVILFTGWVKRRQGKLDEAIDLQHQAAKLDPLNQDIWINLARSYRGARRFGRAHAMLDRALTIVPGDQGTIALKAETYLAEGDLDAAARLVEGVETTPNSIAYATSVYARQLELLLYRREFDQALTKIALEVPRARNLPLFVVALIDRFTGSLHAGKGDQAAARPFFLQAQRELRALREQGHPDLYLHAEALVEIDARLGDRAALEADVLALLKATAKDLWQSPKSKEFVARAYAILGDADSALPLLNQLLTTGYDTSITAALLRLDPAWDPLRGDARFEKVVGSLVPESN